MKTCTKCHAEKNEGEFYRSGTGRVHSWCKACVIENSARIYESTPGSRKGPRARSTALVQAILQEQGIPSCEGSAVGRAKVDLMAWACVPIEAKLARESRPNQFIWTFTSGQLNKLTGLIVAIAEYADSRRVFVVPVEAIRYLEKDGAARVSTLCVTIDSRDLRSSWPLLEEYENRFDLVEIERQKFVEMVR